MFTNEIDPNKKPLLGSQNQDWGLNLKALVATYKKLCTASSNPEASGKNLTATLSFVFGVVVDI